MVTSGLLIEAAEKYFSPAIRTVDFDGTMTTRKHETMDKMSYFFGSVKTVNEIILFKMKDGRNILA